jgi:hypothetical protein
MDGLGGYKFDPSKIGLAHQACFRKFLDALTSTDGKTVLILRGIPGAGKSTLTRDIQADIVVDNTCTSVAEISPYVLAGEAFGYSVKIITLRCDPKIAAARNVHGVPAHAVERMAKTLDEETKRIPPWWSHEIRG